VQVRKVRQRVIAEHIEDYFDTHRAAYDLVRTFEVWVPGQELAVRLATEARGQGLLGALDRVMRDPVVPAINAVYSTRHAGVLRQALGAADSSQIIGPSFQRPHFHVAQVYDRQDARLEGETRVVVEEAVFQEWLEEQRTAATVQWHWT
jgi:hypothetical protein